MFPTPEDAVRYLTRRGAPELAPIVHLTGMRRALPRRGVRGLLAAWRQANAGHVADPLAWLAALDGPTLEAAAGRAPGGPSARSATRRLLARARRHPTVDRDGWFASGLLSDAPTVALIRGSDAATLARLRAYPARFVRWLARMPSSALRAAWLDLADRIVLGRVSGRLPERTRRAVAGRLITLGNAMRGADGAEHVPVPPGAPSGPGVADVVPRVVAHIQQRDRDRRGRVLRTVADGGGCVQEAWLRFFRGALRTGALPGDATTACRPARVAAAMRRLECEAPGTFRATPRTKAPRHNPPLTATDVERMLAVAVPLERVALLLLATTGVRAEAFGSLRAEHVVTPCGTALAEEAVVLEKNSRVRRLPLTGAVREELGAVLRLPLVDGAARHAPLLGHAASTVVRRLSRRAGLQGRRNPHQFRKLLVESALAAGSRLEDVASYLGHASVDTTLRHYWTATGPPHPRAVLGKSVEEQRRLVEWEAERVLGLQAELETLVGRTERT